MYILTAEEIGKGLDPLGTMGGASCGGPSQLQFVSVNSVIRSRIEEALEVASLARANVRDTFQVTHRFQQECRLRLTNGFLTSSAVQIAPHGSEEFESLEGMINRSTGIIDVPLRAGRFVVAYEAGFTADAATKVFKDLPHWMQPIALNIMFLWLRAMNRGAAIKDISHSSLTNGMIRELHARVSQRYQRPRVDCIFPEVTAHRYDSTPEGEWLAW